MRTLLPLPLALPLVPLLLVAGASGATAATDVQDPVACGDTLTQDTVLTDHLRCSGEPGLRIDTPGVTLDLNGYTVTGDTGIGLSITADDVVVRGGQVSGWPVGVYAGVPAYQWDYAAFPLPELTDPEDGDPGPDVTLDDLWVTRTTNVGVVSAYAQVALQNSVLVGNFIGSRAEYGGTLDVTGSEVDGNVLGLQVIDGGPVTVRRSVLRHNDTGIGCSQGRFHVADSVLADNEQGIDSFTCSGSTIQRSLFSGNVEHLATEGFPDEYPTSACTLYVLGGPAPDLPTGSCW